MKRTLCAAMLAASLAAAPAANAVDFDVTITNLSNSIYFTPFLVAAHPAGNNLFVTGQPASANLQAMAEGGDTSGLITDVTALGATMVDNPAGGLLAPASSTTFNMNTDGTANDNSEYRRHVAADERRLRRFECSRHPNGTWHLYI